MTRVKQFMARSLVLGLAGLAAACSTIVEGTDQTVSVTSDPEGAVCELTREGRTIGAINATPGSIETVTTSLPNAKRRATSPAPASFLRNSRE